MKIRTDFITNSSSSAFVVLKTSKYYKKIQKEEDFHFKYGDDAGRGTGVYVGDALLELINYFQNSEWSTDYFSGVYPLIHEYGLENLALVMISDEGMGGELPYPNDYRDVLYEREYH